MRVYYNVTNYVCYDHSHGGLDIIRHVLFFALFLLLSCLRFSFSCFELVHVVFSLRYLLLDHIDFIVTTAECVCFF